MHIHPELQALRGDDTPQRLAQFAIGSVLENWKQQGIGQALEAELACFGLGTPLEDLPILASLFAPEPDSARQFLDELLGPLLARLTAEPLSQSPLRFSTHEVQTTLMIASKGTTNLTLQAIDGAALARRPVTGSACFCPTETHERIMAGTAEVIQARLLAEHDERVELQLEDGVIEAGQVSHRLGLRETQVIQRAAGSLVALRLQRRTRSNEPTREIRLEDGRIIHRSAGHPRDSRLELAAALLGKMGRADAAPLLAAMAEEDGSQSLRWQALRECLGLDTAEGFRTLCAIAARQDDPLAEMARSLRAHLIETYPQLGDLQPCPA